MLCRKRKRVLVDHKSTEAKNSSSVDIKVKSEACTLPLFKNKDFLNQKYNIEKLSARQIAVLIGTSHSTINEALDRLGMVKGKRRSGHVPYGFKIENGRLMRHTREQKVINKIENLNKKGWSFSKIAAELNAKSIPSPNKGLKWWPSSVRGILRRNQNKKI